MYVKHIKVWTVSTLCLPVAWSERVGMCVCVHEPDKGNMPYLKIIYQKKSREILNRKFGVYDKLHSV